MNQRENLLRAVHFETPEAIPMVFHINPACTFWGPVLVTALLTALPEIVRGPLENWRNMAMGLALALIAVFAPEGLFPLLSRGMTKLFGRKDKAKTS